jgi:hypothetical protein
MRLGFRVLDSGTTVNDLQYMNQLTIFPGENTTIYLQFVDLNTVQDYSKWGNRYMPATGATATAVINSINDANTVTKTMYQPFSQDPSIWAFNLAQADTQNMAGVNINVTLIEGANTKIAVGYNVLIMQPQSLYQC